MNKKHKLVSKKHRKNKERLRELKKVALDKRKPSSSTVLDSTSKKAPAKKAPAKKSPAKKAPAKKSPAKK